MEVQAVTKFTGISAQKARLVVDVVRGKQAEEAIAMLQFMPQSSARVVQKTIKSALANATENFGLEASDMYIAKIVADAGAEPAMATIRRTRPLQAVDPPLVAHYGGVGRAV